MKTKTHSETPSSPLAVEQVASTVLPTVRRVGLIRALQNHVCHLCAQPAKREDKHGRFWCLVHAPNGCYLPPGATSFQDNPRSPVDMRYRDCEWYNPSLADGPASQALDYALNRDYHFMGMEWYTSVYKKMFADQPDVAKEWVMWAKHCHDTNNRDKMYFLALQINAYKLKDSPFFDDPAICYQCGNPRSVTDLNNRAWCDLHAPEGLSLFTPEPTSEPVEHCRYCDEPAEYYDEDDGSPLCEACFERFQEPIEVPL